MAKNTAQAASMLTISPTASVRLNDKLTVTGKNYHNLLNMLGSRNEEFEDFRRELITKLHRIDRELAGHISAGEDAAEATKQKKMAEGVAGPLPQIKMHFSDIELEEAISSSLLMLVPQDAPYGATARKDKIKEANGFAHLMNDHAKQYKHFSEYARVVTQAFSYNLFGAYVDWEKTIGRLPKVDDTTQAVTFTKETIYEGNKIRAFDLYNTNWDMTLRAEDVNTQGEFIIRYDRKRATWLKDRLDRGVFFGPSEFTAIIEDYIKSFNSSEYVCQYADQIESNYYFYPAPDFSHEGDNAASGCTNPKTANEWSSWLNGLPDTTFDNRRYRGTFEISETYVWLVPKQYGLGTSAELELWYIVTAGRDYILFAQQKNFAHGKLPISMGDLSSRSSGFLDKSKAEKIIPINSVLSNVLNLQLELTRKNLHGGLTFYNKKVVKFDEIDVGHSGRVPVDMHEHDNDIRRHVLQWSDTPKANMSQDITLLMGLLQQSLPTQSGKRMTDLNRAVTHQSQNVAYESNKQLFVLAKLIDERCMSDLRDMQYYNILEFGQTVEILDEKGAVQSMKPTDFIDINLQFTLTDGLRGVDSIALQNNLASVINMAIQGRLGEQGVDLLALINYYTTVVGDKTDLTQFIVEHPLDAQPQKVKDALMQQLQQAQAPNVDDGSGAG